MDSTAIIYSIGTGLYFTPLFFSLRGERKYKGSRDIQVMKSELSPRQQWLPLEQAEIRFAYH